jgi:hypothetical protein
MSKSSIILDGPSFYTKLGRFYSKWAASQAPSDQPASADATSSTFEVFVFILGKVVDSGDQAQGQKKTQMLHSWLMSY